MLLEQLRGAFQDLVAEDVPTTIRTLPKAEAEAEEICNRVATNLRFLALPRRGARGDGGRISLSLRGNALPEHDGSCRAAVGHQGNDKVQEGGGANSLRPGLGVTPCRGDDSFLDCAQ